MGILEIFAALSALTPVFEAGVRIINRAMAEGRTKLTPEEVAEFQALQKQSEDAFEAELARRREQG